MEWILDSQSRDGGFDSPWDQMLVKLRMEECRFRNPEAAGSIPVTSSLARMDVWMSAGL